MSQLGALERRLVQPNYDVAGTEHVQARAMVADTFGADLQFPILLKGPPHAIDRRGPRYEAVLERRERTSVLSPWDGGESGRLLRPRRDAAMLMVIVDEPEHHGLEVARDLRERVDGLVRPPLSAHITGQQTIGLGQQDASIESSKTAELIAMPILLVVLLFVFRSVVAALIPALFGALIVGASFGVISALATVFPLAASALSLSSMMGLALGVDYSLLIVARFREELAAGAEAGGAAGAALRAATTAGRTVVFAALTLMVAMVTGLLLAPGSFLVSAVVGVGVAVALSALLAVVLLSPVLHLLGPRIDKGSISRRARRERGLVASVAGRALRRPGVAALLIALPLMAFGTQAFAVDPGTPGADLLPEDDRAREDFEAVTRAMGAGWSVPFEVVIKAPRGTMTSGERLRHLDRLQRTIARDRSVATVIGPGPVDRRTRQLRRLPNQLAGFQKQLDGGRRQVARLDSGLSAAAAGTREFRTGLSSAADGARRLAAGGDEAHGAAGQVADGLALASRGIRELEAVLAAMQQGSRQLADGTAQARAGARELAGGLASARSAVEQAVAPQRELADGLRGGGRDLGRLREPAQIAETELARAFRLLTTMTAGRVDPNYEDALAAVGRASGAVSGRDPLTGQQVRGDYPGLDAALAQGSSELAGAADRVDGMIGQTRELIAGLARLEDGAQRLDDGLVELRLGAERLAAGLRRLRTAVGTDAGGVRRLAAGGRELEHGLGRLVAGMRLLDGGLSAGVERSRPLAAGLAQMDAGVVSFRGRLESAAGSNAGLGSSGGRLDSGQLVLAALEGLPHDAHQQAEAVLSMGTGGRAARIFVIPRTDATSPATARLRERLSHVADRFERRTGLDSAVGGQGALVIEYDEAVTERLPLLILGFVVATYIVLIPFFRALLLPLIAVVLNVLTVAAAAGVLVLLFQGDAPLGGPGYLDAIVLVGVLGIVFGLSIDYEVFLLGRMREGWLRSRDVDEAITFGLDRTASVVTGAAAIMLGVFFAFALSDVLPTRQFGVGLFVAVLLDATIVRLVLLPAAMRLCGTATWWIPGWLDRLLPRLDDEPREAPSMSQPASRG